jgi:cysteinyl-tRNA synthetase
VDTLRNAFTETAAKRNLSSWDDFSDALEDDFDTPRALAVMHDYGSSGQLDLLKEALGIFGLASLAEPVPPPPEIVELAEQRVAARMGKDFEEADRIREQIEAAGWEMRDRSTRRYVLIRRR